MGKNIRGPIALCLVLIALLICLYAVAGFYAMGGGTSSLQSQTATNTSPLPPQPPMTSADTTAALDNAPFQFLVSYTARGFEPRIVQVKAGDRIRFTNNSQKPLWIAATGDALYPSVQNGCGSSALDSCKPLNPGEFWQVKVGISGAWEYANNLNKDDTGEIVVQ